MERQDADGRGGMTAGASTPPIEAPARAVRPDGADGARDAMDERGAEIHELLGQLRHARLHPQTPAGLTDAEANVIIAIHHVTNHGLELRPGTIARFARVTPSALSQTLGSLERKGLIRRARDEGDSRSVVVSLTGEGEAVLADVHAQMLRFRAEFLAYLGEDDVDQLIAILRKLVEFLEGRGRL
ncbi:MarR family transcriptional regulator [bacterium]|nr:MarR family transcriptional regulator [bacterium]